MRGGGGRGRGGVTSGAAQESARDLGRGRGGQFGGGGSIWGGESIQDSARAFLSHLGLGASRLVYWVGACSRGVGVGVGVGGGCSVGFQSSVHVLFFLFSPGGVGCESGA